MPASAGTPAGVVADHGHRPGWSGTCGTEVWRFGSWGLPKPDAFGQERHLFRGCQASKCP